MNFRDSNIQPSIAAELKLGEVFKIINPDIWWDIFKKGENLNLIPEQYWKQAVASSNIWLSRRSRRMGPETRQLALDVINELAESQPVEEIYRSYKDQLGVELCRFSTRIREIDRIIVLLVVPSMPEARKYIAINITGLMITPDFVPKIIIEPRIIQLQEDV